MIDRYYVIGNPIHHSLSPKIHHQFALDCSQDLSYQALEVPINDFEQTMHSLHKQGLAGANITLPFKEQAYEFTDSNTERARHASAVNTLIRTQTGWIGDNTDGYGFISDLHRQKVQLSAKKVLILGAGGAVRGIMKPIIDEDPELIVIANRTPEKAERLIDHFDGPLSAISLTDLNDLLAFDCIIHGISAAHSGSIPNYPAHIIHPDSFCYDLSYGSIAQPFIDWSIRSGCKHSSDGLGMLVAQAAESFYQWRNCQPDIPEVLAWLRDQ